MLQHPSGDDLDESGKKSASAKKTWTVVAAVVAAIVAVILGMKLAAGDDDESAGDLTTIVSVANSEEPDEIATAGSELPAVCDVVDAATVGQIVGGRPMTSAPDATGHGCLFTATDEPNIDLTTAYPPYIAQVTLTYNAPQPGLTAGDIAELFETSRLTTDVDVPAPPGGEAYSSGGGSAVVLDRDVMIICGTSGTLRPESIADVQAMCVDIASALRAELP